MYREKHTNRMWGKTDRQTDSKTVRQLYRQSDNYRQAIQKDWVNEGRIEGDGEPLRETNTETVTERHAVSYGRSNTDRW